MDSITTTVRRTCVVAWKCPRCARYVASRSVCNGHAVIPQGALWTRELSMAEIRMKMAEVIDQCVFRLDVSSDLSQNKEAMANIKLGASAYHYVTCPYCNCQPTWSEKPSGSSSFWGSFVWPLIVLLLMIAIVIFAAMLLFALDLENTPPVIVIGLVLLVGILVRGFGPGLVEKWKNRKAVKSSEEHHRPLATFQRDVTIDENDPRSAALAAYIEEYPRVHFSAEISSSMNFHVDID